MAKKNILIIKTGALGDVVRTTPILHIFKNQDVYWLTSDKAKSLLPKDLVNIITWATRSKIKNINFDTVINLEEDKNLAEFVMSLKFKKIVGVFLNQYGDLSYTKESSGWYDMSLISKYKNANERKAKNKKTYQYYLFKMLGYDFKNHPYILPVKKNKPNKNIRIGIESRVGDVWPMKQWAYNDALHKKLLNLGYDASILNQQPSLLKYIKLINSFDIIITGDTLAMHIAMGLGIPTICIFNCTSPPEIHDYNLMEKIISPTLDKAFYRRDYVKKYAGSIPTSLVLNNVLKVIDKNYA